MIRIRLQMGDREHVETLEAMPEHLDRWACSRYNRHLKDDRERNASSAGVTAVSETEFLFTPGRWYKDSLYANARSVYVKESPVLVTVEQIPGGNP